MPKVEKPPDLSVGGVIFEVQCSCQVKYLCVREFAQLRAGVMVIEDFDYFREKFLVGQKLTVVQFCGDFVIRWASQNNDIPNLIAQKDAGVMQPFAISAALSSGGNKSPQHLSLSVN